VTEICGSLIMIEVATNTKYENTHFILVIRCFYIDFVTDIDASDIESS